jgi:hypothetical protein
MSHIGVHRFAAGDREKRGAKDGEGDVKVLANEELEGIERAYRRQHAG